MVERASVTDMMATSGVAFGTSGARGLVSAMTDRVCYAYTAGFLQHLAGLGAAPARVALGGDLRPSTPRILAAVAAAVRDAGAQPVFCGALPSPALALFGLQQRIPAVMVTGSHIPADRNGIKFTTADGEISKQDEEGIRAQVVTVPDVVSAEPGPEDDGARAAYRRRWLQAFPPDFLAGLRLGVYQHSAVGRDLLVEVLRSLGAEVTPLARAEGFVPVDTEAIRAEDVELAAGWAREYGFDAILSTDGDSDRPLLADERGVWLRGDVLGILTARFCGAHTVAAPVSCNTALERCGWFADVRRTRIGSPYVIAALQQAVAEGSPVVVGYEANGGFLTATPVEAPAGLLAPLPTRDPIIVHLAVLGTCRARRIPVSELLATLPRRATASDRLADYPRDRARELIARLGDDPGARADLWPALGSPVGVDTTDGLRFTFAGGEIVHLRPSGNAPELRVYAEADSEARASALVRDTLAALAA